MKKCEYCDIKNYHESYSDNEILVNRISERNGDYTFLTMEYCKDDNTWDLVATGDDWDCAKINYCPFCGRKLNNEVSK